MKFLNWILAVLQKLLGISPGLDYSKMPALKYGDKNAIVKVLQARLKELGYFSSEVGGNFLDKTRDAVKAFQVANGLTPDGEVGAYTWKKLGTAKAKADLFHPVFVVPKPFTHLHPIDVLRSVAGEKEIPGSKDNPLIAHFHEHSGNLGAHSDKNDYSDEVPHCSSAWNWACDMSGCEKSNNALASSWEEMHAKCGAYKFKKGDDIPEGAIVNLDGHVSAANEPFKWTGNGDVNLFGSNQSNTIKTSSYAQSRIRCIHLVKPKAGTVLAPIGILGHKPIASTGSKDESTR